MNSTREREKLVYTLISRHLCHSKGKGASRRCNSTCSFSHNLGSDLLLAWSGSWSSPSCHFLFFDDEKKVSRFGLTDFLSSWERDACKDTMDSDEEKLSFPSSLSILFLRVLWEREKRERERERESHVIQWWIWGCYIGLRLGPI